MRANESDFEAHARQRGLLRDPSSPFKEELVEPLRAHVAEWALDKLIGKAITSENDYKLSQPGSRFCLQHDLPARKVSEIIPLIRQDSNLLLVFVHWRTREFGQELFEKIDDGQWPSHIHPDEWVSREMAEFVGELAQ